MHTLLQKLCNGATSFFGKSRSSHRPIPKCPIRPIVPSQSVPSSHPKVSYPCLPKCPIVPSSHLVFRLDRPIVPSSVPSSHPKVSYPSPRPIAKCPIVPSQSVLSVPSSHLKVSHCPIPKCPIVPSKPSHLRHIVHFRKIDSFWAKISTSAHLTS